ncbi:L-lactate dehydrogenase, partial [Aureobasidium melanogenum]
MSSTASEDSSNTDLIENVHNTLAWLSNNPCPYVAGPESLKKRASVALIVRIQPSYAHPPDKAAASADSINSFFAQDWVKHGEPEVLFIKRAARKGDRWTSHVALPGGRRDPEDEDDQHAAIREAAEEVGIELSESTCIAVGNLPQRIVTTSWGRVPLMVLCPYVFLVTRHDLPPLRLQPTEVASTHWVSVRSLLDPGQRTVHTEDVSNRLANQETGIKKWALAGMLGKMEFSAIQLLPAESLYCHESPTDDSNHHKITPPRNIIRRLLNLAQSPVLPPPPQHRPLILWGLTLGVVADFLDLLPPHNALELWTYPTFTMPDITYNTKKHAEKMGKVYTYDEVSQHRSADSCWVILYNNVYDVTEFVPEHPGGAKIILQLAGQDATEEYDPIHPPGILEETLAPECKLGTIDTSTLPSVEKSPIQEGKANEKALMPLEHCLNMNDIEALATQKMSKKAWAYYFSAADDMHSKTWNNTVYSNILLRPRVFQDITNCDTSTTLLGNKVNLPFFVSPAAMARLGHPDGEHGIAKACSKFGACQIISHNASQTPEQIVEGAPADQVFGWQIYVQTDRKKSEASLARVNKLKNVKFIVLTLDAPVPGKREHDEREGQNIGANLPTRSALQQGSASTTSPDPKKGGNSGSGSVASAMFAGTAGDLTWKTTLPWLAKHTKLPIVLKGLQTHEDAYIASLYAPQVQGIILSNHGGRAADTAPPSIHTLIEIRKYCPEVFDKIEVWVDGGIKRGTDIVKALCLGAKAVGMGRNALFGLGAGGTEGVERVYEILKAEMETTMRLLAVEKVEDLGPQHINARAVERDIYDGPAGLEKLSMWIKAKL